MSSSSWPLCLNCHAKATALQQDIGVLEPEPRHTSLERMARALQSLATFFELLAQSLYRWAAELTQQWPGSTRVPSGGPCRRWHDPRHVGHRSPGLGRDRGQGSSRGGHEDGGQEAKPTDQRAGLRYRDHDDHRQSLTFGCWRYYRIDPDGYHCVDEGVFYADDLPETDPDGFVSWASS